jgi:hypothetical protein
MQIYTKKIENARVILLLFSILSKHYVFLSELGFNCISLCMKPFPALNGSSGRLEK